MRILFTIHHGLDYDRGAPGVTLVMGHAYTERGHDVSYLSFDDLPPMLPEKVKAAVFPEFVAWRIQEQIWRRRAPDVIDSSSGDAWLLGTTLRRRLQRKAPVLTWRSHGLEHLGHLERLREAEAGRLDLSWRYPLYHGRFRLWETAASLHVSDIALFLNQVELTFAVQRLGFPLARAHVVPNGLPRSFIGLPFAREVTGGVMRIAQVGAYTAGKGVEYGAGALAQVLQSHPDVRVTFAGTLCPSERVLADFEPSVRRQISVVTAYRRDDLIGILKDHHIAFFPSLSEGFGVGLLEAMACGLCPVATGVSGHLELVRNEDNGLIERARDVHGLASSLDRLIGDEALLARLRKGAYETAQQYALDRIADRTLSLYEEAAGSIAGGRADVDDA
jgi:glycosyltransferase involved in cell wall biosynthesis